MRYLCMFLVILAFAHTAKAHEAHDQNYAWYRSQQLNEETRQRLGVPWKSCCDEGDHYPTKFRVLNDGSKYGTETYEYLKDGQWKLVPSDIIQRKKTPEGTPVLFIQKTTGRELCLIIDETGI